MPGLQRGHTLPSAVHNHNVFVALQCCYWQINNDGVLSNLAMIRSMLQDHPVL